MLIAFWIVNGILALAFLAAGIMKLVRPKEKLASAGLAWVEDFTTGPVKLIGLAEVIGAIGLILPVLLGVAEILSPIASIALAVLMVGAAVVHARRKENPVAPIVLVVLSVVSAVLGFLVAK
jgi:DoxX-like family